MPKFKKKPVVVDAIQFIADNIKEFIRSFGDDPKDVLVYV